mmetsp:Transcript_29268/g.40446  ORF Transcript_29268/g.40446 Transcript_29268/m.40446 type:complete len:289 (+) Transcript_29268:36-902(+)
MHLAPCQGSEGNVTRGHLLELQHSTDIVVSNVTLRNSPFWTVHVFACQRVRGSNLTILSPHPSPNIDGFDPDSSQDVLIENSYFRVGDDGVAIKSGWDCFGTQYGMPSANIVIRNLTVDSPTAAGVCIGSEMSGGVYNVTVSDCRFVNMHAGLRIKTNKHRGGTVSQIAFENIELENVQVGMQFNDYYGSPNPSCHRGTTWQIPTVENITVKNLKGIGVQLAADMEGLPESPLRGLILQDIHLEGGTEMKCNQFVQGSATRVFPEPCPSLDVGKNLESEHEKSLFNEK